MPVRGAAAAAAAAATAPPPVLSVVAPAGAVQPLTAVAPAPVSVAPAVVAPAVVAPRAPLDAAGAQDLERRLETLKRLREKNLITEDEYQQKRKEILQLL